MTKHPLFTEAEAAEYIGMSVAFLRVARSKGILGSRTPPPPHLQLGRHVRYDPVDLERWLSERRVDPSARPRTSRARAPRPRNAASKALT